MKLRRLLFLFTALVLLGSPVAGLEPNFKPGEELNFDLKWSVFHVGYAKMRAHGLEEYNGEPAWHFSFQVRTNGFADAFFKVRTRIDTWLSEDLTRTVFYKENKREGKTRREIEIEFDWEKREAIYSNYGKKNDPIPLPEGPVLDSVGAVYHFRSIPPEKGGSYTFSVTDGKKVVGVTFPVDNFDKIKVKAGKFQAFRIQPETGELGGVFEKSEDSEVNLWFSADENIYPLQVEGEVTVGSFWAKLSKVKSENPEDWD